MTFSDALTAVQAGKALSRPSFGAGNAVVLVKEVNGQPFPQPFLALRTSTPAGLITWTPQQADMLATDWQEAA